MEKLTFKPILFNTEMVQAIFKGRKTQTRRVVKIQHWDRDKEDFKKPYKVGDILWVRETFAKILVENSNETIFEAKESNPNLHKYTIRIAWHGKVPKVVLKKDGITPHKITFYIVSHKDLQNIKDYSNN